jgi:hypothetical protein
MLKAVISKWTELVDRRTDVGWLRQQYRASERRGRRAAVCGSQQLSLSTRSFIRDDAQQGSGVGAEEVTVVSRLEVNEEQRLKSLVCGFRGADPLSIAV